jgi:Protein of unknown function (DUF3313)
MAGQPARHSPSNQGTNWSQDKAIILESVMLWQHDETSKLVDEDAQQLTGYFYAQLHEPRRQDDPIVTHPGPGGVRQRATWAFEYGAERTRERLAELCRGGAAGQSASAQSWEER